MGGGEKIQTPSLEEKGWSWKVGALPAVKQQISASLRVKLNVERLGLHTGMSMGELRIQPGPGTNFESP